MLRIIFTLFLSVFVFPSISLAGNEGHGGGAFLCPDNTKPSGYRTDLLDLWEARNLPIKYSTKPVDEQIADAVNKLAPINPNLHRLVLEALDYIRGRQAPTRLPAHWSFVTDAEIEFPPDAPLGEGVAIRRI